MTCRQPTTRPMVGGFSRRRGVQQTCRLRDSQIVKAAYRLIGPKVGALLIASVPIGVVLGGLEIFTASVLYAVLAEFNLVAPSANSSTVALGINPVAALLTLAVLTAVLRYGRQSLPVLSDVAFSGRLREAMVRSTLGGITERHVLSVADTSHLLSHAVPKSGEFINSLATLAVSTCLVTLILAGLVSLSWQLTVVTFGFAGVLGLFLVSLRRVYARYIDTIYGSLRKFNAMILRDARNNHLLRVTGLNEQEARNLIEISKENIQAMKRYTLIFSLGNNIPSAAAIFLVIGVFWLNARLAFLPVEGLVPLVYLLSRTSGSIVDLSTAGARVQRNWPFFRELYARVYELFPDEVEASVSTIVPADILPLEVRDLEFGRAAALTAPISLTARRGDVVLVSGSSGRGKTTFVMTLIGLIKPLGGAISWGGMPVAQIDPRLLRAKFGYAGPEPYLIDADIRANLCFGLEDKVFTDKELEDALRLARADFVFDLPGGLSHVLREAGEGISAGQKQRLALTRCVLRKPEVLLLDEATSNIDEDTETEIMNALIAEFPQTTIIAVSHRSSLRRYATILIDL